MKFFELLFRKFERHFVWVQKEKTLIVWRLDGDWRRTLEKKWNWEFIGIDSPKWKWVNIRNSKESPKYKSAWLKRSKKRTRNFWKENDEKKNERSFLFIVWIEFFQNCHFWFFCVMSKIDKSFPLFLLQLLFVNLKKRNKSFSKKKNLFSSSFFDLSRSPFLMFSGQLKSFKWREWERKWLFFLEFLNPNGSLPFLNMIFLKQIFSFFEAKEVHSSVFFVEKYPISLGRKIKFNLKALLSK